MISYTTLHGRGVGRRVLYLHHINDTNAHLGDAVVVWCLLSFNRSIGFRENVSHNEVLVVITICKLTNSNRHLLRNLLDATSELGRNSLDGSSNSSNQFCPGRQALEFLHSSFIKELAVHAPTADSWDRSFRVSLGSLLALFLERKVSLHTAGNVLTDEPPCVVTLASRSNCTVSSILSSALDKSVHGNSHAGILRKLLSKIFDLFHGEAVVSHAENKAGRIHLILDERDGLLFLLFAESVGNPRRRSLLKHAKTPGSLGHTTGKGTL
mmetsp:Transcript_19530/g.39535  ORF Transcript_19530/g.39535 Transcript_19530/m.39535 type:complete len:268 (-) Transcript_19530:145-948(-)